MAAIARRDSLPRWPVAREAAALRGLVNGGRRRMDNNNLRTIVTGLLAVMLLAFVGTLAVQQHEVPGSLGSALVMVVTFYFVEHRKSTGDGGEG